MFNAFEKLGLAACFNMDERVMENAYFRAQAMHHPDRFIGRSEPEKLAALQESADINAAFELLKDPVKRAAHLLVLRGEPYILGDQTIRDPALLMEMMEKQEQLAQARCVTDIENLRTQIQEEMKQVEAALGDAFHAGHMDEAKSKTYRLKYLTQLKKQCEVRTHGALTTNS